MRCSPKLCIGLIVACLGLTALLVATGYIKTASLFSLLPILICPLMCVGMMLFGHSKDSQCCDNPEKPNHS